MASRYQKFLMSLSNQQRAEWKAQYDSFPPEIQALAREFPPSTLFRFNNVDMYVISYTTDQDTGRGMLGITRFDPFVNYEAAQAAREFIHVDHLPRGG